MKKSRLILVVSTVLLGVLFIISLFNPFRDDDKKIFGIEDYFKITMSEKETKDDEDYLLIKIENLSNEDVYNTEITFGKRSNEYLNDNFIWFRIAKIYKNDIITIKLYEETGDFEIDSEKSTSNNATYNISISPKAPDLEIDRCMRIDSITVDSDEPIVYPLDNSYWSTEKTILASLTFVSGGALLILYLLDKKKMKKN